MKRKGYIFEQITDVDNLRMAFYKAQLGKSSKQDVILFRNSLDANLLNIMSGLDNGNYRFGRYRYFTIYDPKKRIICAASFPERVIHHAIMNICAVDFENHQIPYSYACRKNRGTFSAIEQASCYQRKYEWYLKLDVRKYFDSITHDILFEKLQRIYKDKSLLDVFWKIIDSYHVEKGKGLPIGNLTSQYFANHYLSFADKYAVEQLRIPAYVRYMDDMLLWSKSKEELMEKGKAFEQFINRNLQLNLKPFVLNKTSHGLPALGFIIYPRIIKLNLRSRKRFSRKLSICHNMLSGQEISESQFARHVLSLYGFISHARHKGFAGKVLKGIEDIRDKKNQSKKKETGSDAESSNRVNRGGSWNNNARNVRVSNRNNNTPDNRNSNLGFRLARSSKQRVDFEQASLSSPLIRVKKRVTYLFSSFCQTTDKFFISPLT
jgi:retron-type reverse transcriptase